MNKIAKQLDDMIATAPHPSIAEYLETELGMAIVGTLLKMKMLHESGGLLPVDEIPNIAEHVDEADRLVVDRGIAGENATAKDIALQVAELVDKSLKRLYLTDACVNHEAFLDLSAGIAQLHSGLCRLQTNEELDK